MKSITSKDPSIDPSLLKLITKYIDELADQISAAVIMAISAVDQGLKAIRKLIDKMLRQFNLLDLRFAHGAGL